MDECIGSENVRFHIGLEIDQTLVDSERLRKGVDIHQFKR